MRRLISVFVILPVLCCGPTLQERQMKAFIDAHLEKVKPQDKERKLLNWRAATTGESEAFEKAGELELKWRQLYSEKAGFQKTEKYATIQDPVLARQGQLLYYTYLENQIESDLLKKIVDKSTRIEQKFTTFRGILDGRKVSDNEIQDILVNETESGKREKAWLASKQVGREVAQDVIELVRLRNQAAEQMGYENYHVLALTTGEQNIEELDRIFNRLARLTDEPFRRIKNRLDAVLAERYGIDAAELKPWHYHDPFFQEVPQVFQLDLNGYYAPKDVKDLATVFYEGIGLPVESILENSDLYAREGKNQHAFCTDIDREGDIRILCNLKNDQRWMDALLHELGHAVYDKYQDPNTPYLLRTPAHAFTTEAVAMLFGRLSQNAAWMRDMLGLSDGERAEIEKVSSSYLQFKQLIFARWAMVMYEFEKSLYATPDGNLDDLWWNLVEKYQYVQKPADRHEPDWAAKIHIAMYPCYYHNYLLGELLASQIHHYLVFDLLGLNSDKDVSYVGEKRIGDFLKTKIFEAGAVYTWGKMIERAMGESLTPDYFVQQFVN